jgi:hypothetical protein
VNSELVGGLGSSDPHLRCEARAQKVAATMASMTAIPISAPAAGDHAVMSSNNAPPIAAIDAAIPVAFDLFILSTSGV